ncbi:transcriptional regulator BetI [bacterium BMS3Abin07]|nr:transcriptional regulator BetI [bacterium BMS3Abin07]GBE32092.1 transcriptional regulator BetI [bacterium BMS3Bbin05]HDO22841.1 TetR/AcrR family transcriptional regulator [Nitrospirota bacterium]HDZ88104.1 TetR/AcrR family transcriptional regulator [Nitrospirota bacterium]
MNRSDTKKRLMESTLRLISEKGYLGATTKEIASKAGVSELTLFRNFGSKEKLFESVLNEYTFLPRLKELLPGLERLDYREALAMIGLQFFETLQERKPLVKIIYSEINLYPEKIRRVYFRFVNGIIKNLAGYFRCMQKKNELRSFPPELGAKAFMGMIFSYFKAEEILKGREIGKKEIDRTIRTFVDIFVDGTRTH